MKNKFFINLIVYFLLSSAVFAEPFIFKTKEIQIKNDGNLILAENGVAFSSNKDLEIQAMNFEYYKKSDLLRAFNGVAFIKSDNLEIEFNEIELDQKKSTLIAKNNVKINDIKNDLIVKSNLITYYLNTKILESKENSILEDKFNNIFDTQSFNYSINKNILKVKNANFKDYENNNFYIELAYINTFSNKLFGKDVEIDLNNKSFDVDNEPRLKGNSITYENQKTTITKGVFTTCKKNDKCPPWQMSAEKINHDKQKKIISYKNAWLKVYDVPVMYFPKFFHPDPTVKRKSGFLIPAFKNSSNANNSYLSVPYFHAISESRDMTFAPRFYSEDKFLLQTEYRKVNSNSSHFSDFSFYKEKNFNSKNHIFYNYQKELNFAYFEDSKFDLNFEKVSSDTYLKGEKLKSPIISDYDVLENSLNLGLYSEDLSIETDIIVYENLTKTTESDKYEYVLPSINLVKNLDNKTNLNGDFTFKSLNFARSYNTNTSEKVNINDIIFNSFPTTSNNGFYNNYDFIIKNVNSNTRKSSGYKENENFYLSSLIQLNSSLPLIKENDKYQNILTPKLSLRISPDHSYDFSENENRIDVNNIYNLDRIGENSTTEGGVSLTYGNEFLVFDKQNSNELFGIKLANNLRIDENDALPKNAQLNQKTSNFFGEILYNPNDFINFKYDAAVKNNLQDKNYENLVTEISVNNFVTKFDYVNENNTLKKNSYLLNSTEYSFDSNNSLTFSTRENKTSDLTEYYNLMYQYKNDCLVASIEYNKDYYDDRDIKPEENIFLKLTIIPFGETSSPNLKDY